MNWKNDRQLILAIESSCDETSVAIVEKGKVILSNIIATQIASHKRFGGVVPEIASRHHVEAITKCIDLALEEAKITVGDLSAVAVTYGPGLVGALLIGITAAKAFAWSHNLPLIPVNHMAGHIHAADLVEDIEYPCLALLVSGGHTELVYMPKANKYQIVGETRDDAAGEAYDKVGRILGLPYPSGKPIDKLAHQGLDIYNLPRAMINEDNFDFSFSGLKSAVINLVHNAKQRGEEIDSANLAASFQQAVIDVLVKKTLRACQKYQVKQLIVAGGVAANQGLRENLTVALKEENQNIQLIFPPLRLCGDNAAMIAAAAYVKVNHEDFKLDDWQLNAKPSLSFGREESNI